LRRLLQKGLIWMLELSPRQREIVEGLCGGESPKTVAVRLGISYHRVREQLQAARNRNGLRSSLDLAMQYAREGMRRPDD
jgi:DNA-binding CsgD family transcriptional regulator